MADFNLVLVYKSVLELPVQRGQPEALASQFTTPDTGLNLATLSAIAIRPGQESLEESCNLDSGQSWNCLHVKMLTSALTELDAPRKILPSHYCFCIEFSYEILSRSLPNCI